MKRTVEISYTEYWVIRVVRKNGACSKTVVKEIEMPTPPTEQHIIEVLLTCEPNEFISVSHNYRM